MIAFKLSGSTQRYFWLLLLILWQEPVCAAPSARVLLVKSEDGPAYESFVEGFRQQLRTESAGIDAEVVRLQSYQQGSKQFDRNLTIAIGVAALKYLSGETGPVLGTMIPKPAFEKIASSQKERIASGALSAVFIDQSPLRQMALIRTAFPEARRVGMLFGRATSSRAGVYREAAGKFGLALESRTQISQKGMVPVLDQLLDLVDVLLVIPDPEIHNATTAQHVLLTAYRHQVPVIGYSESYARAGGVLSIYGTPELIGQQAARMVMQAATRNWKLGQAAYSSEFRIKQNWRVSRSLGLSVPGTVQLERKIHDLLMESGR